MLKNTWNVTPPGWIHSRLGEIWIYNEGIRSQLSWEVVASLPLPVPLRRLGGGGQSARSSLNVIWLAPCRWVRFTQTRFFTFLLFCETHDLVWEVKSVSKKRMKKLYCENYWLCFRKKKWLRWVISFKPQSSLSSSSLYESANCAHKSKHWNKTHYNIQGISAAVWQCSRGERGTFCHGAHSVSRGFSKTIQIRYYVAI